MTTTSNNINVDTPAVRRKAELHNVVGCEHDLHIEPDVHNNLVNKQEKPLVQYSIENLDAQTTNHVR